MDLFELEKKAEEINECAESIMGKYREVVTRLSNLYGIISKVDASQTRDLEFLINEYNDAINKIDQYYGQGSYDLLSYANATNENLVQLAANLKATNEISNGLM